MQNKNLEEKALRICFEYVFQMFFSRQYTKKINKS